MPENASAIRAIVRGHVQGVGFRDYVESLARTLGLSGYVRNELDGRAVEVIAEGPRAKLEQLIERLRSGPRMSRVDAVGVDWGEATGEYDGFVTRF
ncbi:MAG: acylphosphatase [Chloroflexota bacterium]